MAKSDKTAIDIVLDDRKELVEKIVEQMESGRLPWHQGWINTGSFHRPYNPLSTVAKNGYHGGNFLRLMIASAVLNYDDPRYVTAKQAFAKGYHLKSGSKGILLENWQYGKTKTVINENGQEEEQFIPYKHPIVNYFKVFNAEQFDNFPELERPKIDHEIQRNEHIDKLIADIKSSAECPVIEKQQGRAFYSPSLDQITLPLFSQFESSQEFLATLLHEMSHSTGHIDRLNRQTLYSSGNVEEYAREELRAELGCVFTQADLGIHLVDGLLENHSAYLQSWISVIKNDPNELFRACNDADKISERLISNYNIVLSHVQEQDQTVKHTPTKKKPENIEIGR